MWPLIHALPQPVPAIDCCSVGHHNMRFVGARQPWPWWLCGGLLERPVYSDDSGGGGRRRRLGRVQGALAIKCSGRNGGGSSCSSDVMPHADASGNATTGCKHASCNRSQRQLRCMVSRISVLPSFTRINCYWFAAIHRYQRTTSIPDIRYRWRCSIVASV